LINPQLMSNYAVCLLTFYHLFYNLKSIINEFGIFLLRDKLNKIVEQF